jgi:hypothetical protein
VGLQIAAVSIQAYMLARANRWRLDFGYQAMVLLGLLALGATCRFVAETLIGRFDIPHALIIGMVSGGALYMIATLTMVYRVPALAGLSAFKGQSWSSIVFNRAGAK